jgi:hypothetical protein
MSKIVITASGPITVPGGSFLSPPKAPVSEIEEEKEDAGGIFRNCYLCDRDLTRLDPKYIHRQTTKVTSAPMAKTGLVVTREYTISYCTPCVKRFLT